VSNKLLQLLIIFYFDFLCVEIAVYALLEYIEVVCFVFIDFHGAGKVSHAIALVGCTPDSHQLVIEEHLLSIFAELVCASHELEVVHLSEFVHNVLTLQPACPSVTNLEPFDFGIRVWPAEVGDGAFVGQFTNSIDVVNVVNVLDAWRQSPMYAENAVVDEGCDRQGVEHVAECLPHSHRPEFLQDFILESVCACDLPRFVIASDHPHSVGVFDFEQGEQTNGFDWMVSTVDVVPQKQLLGPWGRSPHIEQFVQVEQLAVDVSHQTNWKCNLECIGLRGEYLQH